MATETVHVFASTGRFSSFEEICNYVHETYDKDGNGSPSPFIREVGLSNYEPACIEAIPTDDGRLANLRTLLDGSSYSEQWLSQVDTFTMADAAICVFPPNKLASPEKATVQYVGVFCFER